MEIPKTKREVIPFRFAIPALGTVLLADSPLNNGVIVAVEAHFPDGCDALVGIRVLQNNDQFLPRSGYLALNDTTRLYEFLNRPITQKENINVDMLNGDGANPHTISVNVIVESLVR